MTLADAVESIVNSSTKDAAKRPSWAGYVKRGTVNATTGAYDLTFKNRAGTTYVYSFDGSAWTAPSTALPIDAELLASFLAGDWMTGSSADFDTAAGNTGTW